jgi:hypothetical protein
MKKNNQQILANNSFSEFLIYTTPNEKVRVEVFLRDENIWLTQARIAELFGVDRSVVTKHLKNIFESAELEENSVCANIAHTADDGKKYQTKFYSLDAIISVGYRVNSLHATQFRIWATARLKEYIIKGFTMDDERLKNPQKIFGQDYFEEQLERIKDIRSSERRFYQKVTDIYAKCSADYDANNELTKSFFATIQNKLHWAISKKTAAEIIHSRANGAKPNMGLTSWKNSPKGEIRKSDVSIAKNYLNEEELENLNQIVSMYLDYAEDQARRRIMMNMADWIKKLDAFLQFNERELLKNSGKISQEIAKIFAENEFEKYRVTQDKIFESDFDREMKKLEIGSGKKR